MKALVTPMANPVATAHPITANPEHLPTTQISGFTRELIGSATHSTYSPRCKGIFRASRARSPSERSLL